MSDARQELFDRWAADYERAVADQSDPFPFDGYGAVLDTVLAAAEPLAEARVLDLGTGTGNLAARFRAVGCRLWGLDFSAEMLRRARQKLPGLHLVALDLVADAWPALSGERFDRIVSAYLFHEFPLTKKMELLARLATDHLYPGGRIIVGDIAFPTASVRARRRREWAERWDDDEYYWAADVAVELADTFGFTSHYCQVSSCGGVFTFVPAADSTAGAG